MIAASDRVEGSVYKRFRCGMDNAVLATRALVLGAMVVASCAVSTETASERVGETHSALRDEPGPSESAELLTGLLVIVDYPDAQNPLATDQAIESFESQLGDYFADTSFGKVQLEHIVRRHAALHPASYYGGAEPVVNEVIDALVGEAFDFTQLSAHPDDHTTSEIVLLNPAVGLQITSLTPGYSRTVPGVTLGGYVWMESAGGEFPTSFAVHELGHALFRFADLATGTLPYASNGVGAYCLYGPNAATQRVNPYYMLKMGWIEPVELTPQRSGEKITIPPAESRVFKYTNPAKPTEYFLVESTVHRGIKYGDLDGLFIWHIDEDAWRTSDYVWYWNQNMSSQMTPDKHYTVAIEQADYRFDLEGSRSVGDATDHFVEAAGVVFGDFTYPDAKWWDNSNSGLVISDIVADAGTVGFTFKQVNPVMSVSAGSVALEVASGGESERSITLRNDSADTELEYEVLAVHNGYEWTDSDQGGTTFEWESISATGSPVAFVVGGPESATIHLPFAFPYYGKTYTEISAFAKGCVTFAPAENLDYSVDTFPSLRMAPTVVCPAMSTSYPQLPGDADRVSLLAQADKVILQYDDVEQYEYGGIDRSTMTFQVILYADGRVKFQYLSLSSPVPYRCLVGLQNERMNRGVTVASSSDYIHENLAVLFTPISSYRLHVGNTRGSLAPGASTELPLTVRAANLDPGVYDDTIEIRHTARNQPNPLLIPITTSVVPAPSQAAPCDGLCTAPQGFGAHHHHYYSGPIGWEAGCWETLSELHGGFSNHLHGRMLTVNGTPLRAGFWELPSKRHGGYCVQVAAGGRPWASFVAWWDGTGRDRSAPRDF